MDALSVAEKTGLDYASKATTKDDDATETSVMHACGHVMHVTCLMAAAEWVASKEVKEKWPGTLIVLFQPNEERGKGAGAMVDGGLNDKVPVPDVLLVQHFMPMRTGKVMVKAGTMIAAADSFKITVFGRGGHGSMPQLCIDPVVLGANIVVRLQGIVAREVDPADSAVVTVGSLQAGHSENVIADQAVHDGRYQNAEARDEGDGGESSPKHCRRGMRTSGCEKPPTFEQTRGFL